jgi:hypothetical protein
MSEETPRAAIERLRAALAPLSDDLLLDRLRSVEPMPDGGMFDPAWDAPATWDRMYLLIAFSDEIGARRLVSGIRLLYERVPLADPGGVTQTFRHGAEKATVDNYSLLVQILRPLLRHERQGTRRAAADELGILRDPIVIDDLSSLAREDPEGQVRSQASFSLWMIANSVEDAALRGLVTDVLRDVASSDASQDVRYEVANLLATYDPEAARPLQEPPIEWYSDPTWMGHTSGRDAVQATRRIIRALITADLSNPILSGYLEQSASRLVMTRGAGVYPAMEPEMPANRSAPDWRSTIALWTEGESASDRTRSGLAALIELRRASPDEVRARLIDVLEDASEDVRVSP